jgi:polysaccharide biosynthesis/export protein
VLENLLPQVLAAEADNYPAWWSYDVLTLGTPDRQVKLACRELKECEQKQLGLLGERMQSDLAVLLLQTAAANQAKASQGAESVKSLLARFKPSRAAERLVVDLPGLVAGSKGSSKDVMLRDVDLPVGPRQKHEVTVIGKVQTTLPHRYNACLGRDGYVNLIGGTTRKAEAQKVYAFHTDGGVVAWRSEFLRRNYDVAIQPGDTIVVPLDTERMPRLTFWQAVTQVVCNLAISIATVRSF